MTQEALQLATAASVITGTFFSVVGVIGYVRLPDAYTKLHAVGKVGIFGVALLAVGAVVWTPSGLGRGLVLAMLVLLAGPVTAHVLASAAYRVGITPYEATRNDLEDIAKRGSTTEEGGIG